MYRHFKLLKQVNGVTPNQEASLMVLLMVIFFVDSHCNPTLLQRQGQG
jgi:hypothetical protein